MSLEKYKLVSLADKQAEGIAEPKSVKVEKPKKSKNLKGLKSKTKTKKR